MSEGGRLFGLKVAGLAAVAAVWLIAASAAGAQLTIPAGDDLFETEPNNTTSSFGGPTTLDAQASGLPGGFSVGPPLPAGFLGTTCEGFAGTVNFGGEPLDPGNLGDADTIVRRLAPATLNPTATVPIEIVELSLVSMEPITVQCNGQETLWEVGVTLSDQQQQGEMQMQQTSENGGTFSSFLPVVPKFTFTRINDSAETHVLDGEDLGPQVLNGLFFNAQNVPWRAGCIEPALAIAGVNDLFCPGLTPEGQKVLTIEQALFARHGIFPVQPSLEHFQCYKLGSKKFKKRTVTLNDQFENTSSKVKKRKELCNPTKKNSETFLNKRAHLTRYSISGKAINAPVVTRNQFGSQRLLVKKPKLLMVPTEKQDRGQSRKRIQTETDHFQCYSVQEQGEILSVDGKPKKVRLKDQFSNNKVKVKDPKWLCTPVDKNEEGLLHPVRHLLCYAIEAKKQNTRVTIRNQFEKTGVKVKNARELCVPTLKQVLDAAA